MGDVSMKNIATIICFLFLIKTSVCFGDLSNKMLVYEHVGFKGAVELFMHECRHYNPSNHGSEEKYVDNLVSGRGYKEGQWVLVDRNELPVSSVIGQGALICWGCCIQNDRVVVDLDAIKYFRMNKIRRIRNYMLQDSDVDLLLAMERNDHKECERLKRWRQALRDIPQTFDMSQYVAHDHLLYCAIPSELCLDFEEFYTYEKLYRLTKSPKAESRSGEIVDFSYANEL
jgi:hypothetical protein